MAPMIFADKIAKGEAIDVYNFGKHRRDFTYIDDIVGGVIRTLEKTASANSHWNSDRPDPASAASPYRVYNIGCNKPAELMHFIELMEQAMGRQVEKNCYLCNPVMYQTPTPTSMHWLQISVTARKQVLKFALSDLLTGIKATTKCSVCYNIGQVF